MSRQLIRTLRVGSMCASKWNPQLTAEQLRVLRDRGTERPHTGAYLHNKSAGIYHCANCDMPLYSSSTKFDSGCGWPAFYQELRLGALRYIRDSSLGMERVEIRCGACDGHLGHVFEGEGFAQRLGLPQDVRHCVNSCSLRFRGEDS
ncbi:AaceriAFR708Wp [[Ashbya] aceris (nom. inval.)]|nr:AaceriAFR708Wp [[Ashbya] aceris (nom. inval.)]